MTDVVEYLRSLSHVSIPQLQLEMGISYKEAVQNIALLQKNKLISKEPSGIEYTVNTLSVNARDLSDIECMDIGLQLTERDYRLFDYCRFNTYDPVKVSPCETEKQQLQKLGELGLIHCFDGVICISVSETAVEKLSEWILSENTRNAAIELIAIPIVQNSIREGIPPDDLFAFPAIPKRSKKYIELALKKYELTGIVPTSALVGELDQGTKNSLMFEIVESLAAHKYYYCKASYVRNAKKNAEIIKKSVLCSPYFKEAAERAYLQIKDELTYTTILEIRRFVLYPDSESMF